jgi:uncharacterized protein (TIGR02231 family)
MRFALTMTVSCLALVLSLPALAEDMTATSKIDAVTVYPDAASVTRLAEVDLPEGTTTLVFRGLPIDLDPASLRTEGTATAGLTIGSVESRVAPAAAPTDDGLDARIKALRDDRETVQVTIEALDGKRAMIQHFAQANPERATLDGKPLDVGHWDTAWDRVGEALGKVGSELQQAHAKARDLDAQIKGLEASRQQPAATAGPARDVTVALEADAATKATIKLTYRIAGANWVPSYDARLNTGGAAKSPSLDLVRRAAVSQRTGEPWTDVALSVSTVSTQRGTAVPDIQPKRIAFDEEGYDQDAAPAPGVLYRHSLKRAAPAPARPAAAESAPEPMAPAPPPKAAEERETILNAGAYEASFLVPGRITVPSDGAQKSFRLDSRTVSPTLLVKTIPALDQTAYLEAQLTNDGDAPLLPGDVHLLRDGTFVGTGTISLVAPGDTLDLGFGADDRVKVARVPVKRKENDPAWAGTNKMEIDEFKSTVKNLHEFPVKVQLVDQMPFSETTTIVVEPMAGTTPPTDKIVADKRGVMGWTFDLAPNANKEIHLVYRMKWPVERDIVYETVPVQPQ